MFHHRKHTVWQRIVMAFRDINEMAKCFMQCPNCGSGKVQGSGDGPFQCLNCSMIWQ